jgi:hypothetical protein
VRGLDGRKREAPLRKAQAGRRSSLSLQSFERERGPRLNSRKPAPIALIGWR